MKISSLAKLQIYKIKIQTFYLAKMWPFYHVRTPPELNAETSHHIIFVLLLFWNALLKYFASP